MTNRFGKTDKRIDGLTAYFMAGTDDQYKEILKQYHSARTIPAPPKSKQEKLIYSLLEQYCDFIFCQNEENYSFYSKEVFYIFAKDKIGGLYGFIGGTGDIEEDNYPIAYVSLEGQSGKIANSLKDLLSLIIFYPFWTDLLKHSNEDVQKVIEMQVKEILEDMPDYYKAQQTILDSLDIKKHDYSIDRLFNCLSEEPKFIVYSTDDDSPSEDLLR